VTDIIYIRTWQGWLYLAVVMDLFSRMIVGWAATHHPPRARAQRGIDGRPSATTAR
jgi:putative transposase